MVCLKKQGYQKDEFIRYKGRSYWGEVTFKFNKELNRLNVINSDGTIYVYTRATPPKNQKTCSLIQKKHSNNLSSAQPFSYSTNNIGYDNSFNNLDINKCTNLEINTSRQKTKVRKKCAHCSGKGESIQHEYVSTFGLDGPPVYCNICNQSWSYGTVHAHHRCNRCKGIGYYEYE